MCVEMGMSLCTCSEEVSINMPQWICKMRSGIVELQNQNRFLETYKKEERLRTRYLLQMIVAVSFLIFSVTNVLAKSYVMLMITVSGCIINLLFAWWSQKSRNSVISSLFTVLTCAVMFGLFSFFGGNDGFACLWGALLPTITIVIVHIQIGLFANIMYLFYLCIIFWTPVRGLLPYSYNDQFCLRFPLYFLVCLLLGALLGVSLCHSEYNECMRVIELERMTELTNRMARTDELTGLHNRRSLFEYLGAIEAGDQTPPAAVLMMDIDHFKEYNDRYGHAAGDECLRIFANTLCSLEERYKISFYRYGGEEFVALVWGCDREGILGIAEQIRQAVEKQCATKRPITVSIGATLCDHTQSPNCEKCIQYADKAAYRAKEEGRNRVVYGEHT